MHAFEIHQYGDLSRGCKSTGKEWTAAGFLNQVIRTSARGLGTYYDWSDTVVLDGKDSILGRSVLIYGNGDEANKILGCGIIQPGCSPCRDGSCFPNAKEDKKNYHY